MGPAAKIEGYRHAGVAQFVGERAVDEGAGNDHASDAQGGDALRSGAASTAILDQASLEDAYHGFENGLEGAPGSFSAARDVGRQRHHGARILDVLKMLAGKIGANDLRVNGAGKGIPFPPLPGTPPVRARTRVI